MKIRAHVWFLYAFYLVFCFVLMLYFRADKLPDVVERAMATIMLYTFVWAASVTQAVYVGNRIRAKKAELNKNGV